MTRQHPHLGAHQHCGDRQPGRRGPEPAGTQTTISVNEGSSASLAIADALTEIDTDSSLGTIRFSNVPTGVTSIMAAPAGNTWTLTSAQLSGLQISVPDSDQGNFTLSVVATPMTAGNISTSAPPALW